MKGPYLNFRLWLLAIWLVVMWGIASEADLEEEIRETELYCDLAGTGAWPDYRRMLDTVCKEQGGALP